MRVLELKISEIEVVDRLRAVDAEKVAELQSSMAEQGQMQPIEVRESETAEGHYELVFGAHRLAALTAMGAETVSAVLFDGSIDEARLREIDENLYRHELTPFDQASFLAERRALYEKIHGKLQRGKPKGNYPNLRQLSFFDETTKKFGLPRSTIQRALTRRTRFDDKAWLELRATKFAKRGADIDLIAKLPKDQQLKVVRRLTASTGAARNVREAIQQVTGAATKPQVDFAAKLSALWAKAPARDRKTFLAALKEAGEIEG
jgi:ParB family chromosome partitioning protein